MARTALPTNSAPDPDQNPGEFFQALGLPKLSLRDGGPEVDLKLLKWFISCDLRLSSNVHRQIVNNLETYRNWYDAYQKLIAISPQKDGLPVSMQILHMYKSGELDSAGMAIVRHFIREYRNWFVAANHTNEGG